jgi:hypothetical protein
VGTSQSRNAGTIANATYDGQAVPAGATVHWEAGAALATYTANQSGTCPQTVAYILAQQAAAGNSSGLLYDRIGQNGLEVGAADLVLATLIGRWKARNKVPRAVVFRLGDNDQNSDAEAGNVLTYGRRLRAIAREAWPGVRVLWVGPTVGTPTSTYPTSSHEIALAAYQQLADEDSNSAFIDTSALSHVGGDGIHLGATGQDAAAALINARLVS